MLKLTFDTADRIGTQKLNAVIRANTETKFYKAINTLQSLQRIFSTRSSTIGRLLFSLLGLFVLLPLLAIKRER